MNKVRLGDMLTFQRGYDLTHMQMKGGKIPVVGSSEIIGWHDEVKVKSPVLLIGRSGTVGRPQFYETDVWAHNTTLFVSDFHGNNPKFCFYFLKNLNLEDYANSSGVPTLNRNFIHPLIVNFPDIETQTVIARVLSSLDDKIELNNKINIALEDLARTIYEYWFVQNAEKTWEKKKIGEIAETGSGGTPLSSNKEYYENGNIAWINSSELNSGYILNAKNFITEKGLNCSNAKFFPVNSILIALYGATAGKVSLLTIPATTNQAICAVMPFSQLHILYLKFYLSNLYNYFISASSGSARDNLSQNLVRNLIITLPPNDNLDKFNKIVAPLICKIIKNRQESANLAQLRDFLLPLLMNGQVTVDEAQDEPTMIPLKSFADSDSKYQTWKEQIGLAARGDIDEKTLRNIYEAIDENDR